MNRKIILLFISLCLVPFISHADDTEVLENDVQLVFMGVDPATQGLLFEGTSIGEYGSGTVKILGFPFKLIDTQLYFAIQWTLTAASGDSVTGSSSSRLDLISLQILERGTIITCFGEFSHLCGCTFQLVGIVSDSEFIPHVTTVSAKSGVTVVEGGDCFARSDEDEDEDKD